MPGKEFFHVLRAHVGCDGKKAGLQRSCCAKILWKSKRHCGEQLTLNRTNALAVGGHVTVAQASRPYFLGKGPGAVSLPLNT